MKKEKFIKLISEKSGVKKKRLEEISEEVFRQMQANLAKFGNVVIKNLGVFRLEVNGPKVILKKNNLRKIIPPAFDIKFDSIPDSIALKEELLSVEDMSKAISIKFGMSYSDSNRIVRMIFESIVENVRQGSEIQFEGFGKFRRPKEREMEQGIIFIPAKKFSKRINKVFSGLKERELAMPAVPDDYSGEAVTKEIEGEVHPEGQGQEKNQPVRRKLVSDALVKLHNEITKKSDDENEKGLWR